MSNYTPASLRRWAEKYERATGNSEMANVMYDHADAWEAERKDNSDMFFQFGCFLSLLQENSKPAYRALERAKELGHPYADDQLAALATKEE
jgi:hypothetical protein